MGALLIGTTLLASVVLTLLAGKGVLHLLLLGLEYHAWGPSVYHHALSPDSETVSASVGATET